MFDLAQNVLLIFIEIICCKIFYETFGEIRYKGWGNKVQIALLLVGICLLSYRFSEHFILRQVVDILMISVIMLWYVKISFKKSFVLAVLFDSLLLAMDYLVVLVIGWMSLKGEISEQQYEIGGVLAYLLVKIVLFLVILIIRNQLGRKSMEMMVDTEWLRFLFFPVFTIMVISAMLPVFEYVHSVEQANLLSIIAFGMVGMNIIVFCLINDILKREMQIRENKISQMQAKNQLEMYKAISENFDNQRRKSHEYKNQITCIEALMGKKQYDKLEEYVKKIYNCWNNELDVINTNNVIVNAILNTKYQEAKAKGIAFAFRVNDLSKLEVDDEDMVTILSNLLNNAIEACELCEDKRIIKFKFVKESDFIVIAVKNTFNCDVAYENGKIKSIKTFHTDEHGIGIKNILKVIGKYDGSYVIEDRDKEFCFSIIIPT